MALWRRSLADRMEARRTDLSQALQRVVQVPAEKSAAIDVAVANDQDALDGGRGKASMTVGARATQPAALRNAAKPC